MQFGSVYKIHMHLLQLSIALLHLCGAFITVHTVGVWHFWLERTLHSLYGHFARKICTAT